MSYWCHTMVDGFKFWISQQRLAFLSSFSRWQLIQNLAPFTIVRRQCDIRITNYSIIVKGPFYRESTHPYKRWLLICFVKFVWKLNWTFIFDGFCLWTRPRFCKIWVNLGDFIDFSKSLWTFSQFTRGQHYIFIL